ncbi:hypothetical protein L208DRAFT_1182755, partial [Tricholoma matsutake]
LDGNPKPPTTICGTYSHAQKMQASMTYIFGCIYGLGSLPWHKNETTGKMVGNLSVSQTVSSYMLSLRHQKVRAYDCRIIRASDIANSCCQEILKKLHNFNHQPENRDIPAYAPGSCSKKTSDKWGGECTHYLLTAAYNLAFWCMLRVDEVLKIKMSHIKIERTLVTLTLPYRKTH